MMTKTSMHEAVLTDELSPPTSLGKNMKDHHTGPAEVVQHINSIVGRTTRAATSGGMTKSMETGPAPKVSKAVTTTDGIIQSRTYFHWVKAIHMKYLET